MHADFERYGILINGDFNAVARRNTDEVLRVLPADLRQSGDDPFETFRVTGCRWSAATRKANRLLPFIQQL